MNHPHEDDLLLLAYGEIDDATAAAELERHLAGCAPCRERFSRLERGRVALDWSVRRGRVMRRVVAWVAAGMLAAAAVAAFLLIGRPAPRDQASDWPRPLEWSATAGYVAGGRAVITIDAQLTRLEEGWSYVRP